MRPRAPPHGGDGRRRARLAVVQVGLAAANAFVSAYHRHLGPTRGHKFSLAVAPLLPGGRPGPVCGVAICGRPVARLLDDGWTLEVLRVASDGTPNCCSALYAACRRAALALGSRRVLTYTLASEAGVALRAAGWRCLGLAGGGAWARADRPRIDRHPTGPKRRWERRCRAGADPPGRTANPTDRPDTRGGGRRRRGRGGPGRRRAAPPPHPHEGDTRHDNDHGPARHAAGVAARDEALGSGHLLDLPGRLGGLHGAAGGLA
jgi:hypothetical protein